jgi:DNA-binding winged helix-turn-helix (wHTH) protein
MVPVTQQVWRGEYQFTGSFLQLQIAMTRSFLIDPTEKAFPSDKRWRF